MQKHHRSKEYHGQNVERMFQFCRRLHMEPNQRLLPEIMDTRIKKFIVRQNGLGGKTLIHGKVNGKKGRGRNPIRFLDHIKTITSLPITTCNNKKNK